MTSPCSGEAGKVRSSCRGGDGGPSGRKGEDKCVNSTKGKDGL